MTRVPRVAFQGEAGAFSHAAVQQLLGNDVKVVPCSWFDQVFARLAAAEVDAAVIPIENTLHGSVHENYDHLLHHPEIRIAAETNVRIIHNLIAAPGTQFRAIERVYSHPVALNQCLKFFENNPGVEKVPFYDTAGSVKMLMQDRPPGAAAIASSIAASIYGARILRRSIEDDRQNFTRFFLLHAKRKIAPAAPGGTWKTSLVFSTRNTPGALFRGLSAFALREINLMKIESRPLRGRPWEYLFYLDLEGREQDVPVQKALGHLEELADFLRVLGSYPVVRPPAARARASA